jgi:chromosome segregation ATPase
MTALKQKEQVKEMEEGKARQEATEQAAKLSALVQKTEQQKAEMKTTSADLGSSRKRILQAEQKLKLLKAKLGVETERLKAREKVLRLLTERQIKQKKEEEEQEQEHEHEHEEHEENEEGGAKTTTLADGEGVLPAECAQGSDHEDDDEDEDGHDEDGHDKDHHGESTNGALVRTWNTCWNTWDEAKCEEEAKLRSAAAKSTERTLTQQRRAVDLRALERDLELQRKLTQSYEEVSALEGQLEANGRTINGLVTSRYRAFSAAGRQFNTHLSTIYRQLCAIGGQGDCELVFAKEPSVLFSEGILFHCKPDASPWQEFRTLSGGQQALCGLALTLSFQAVFPCPFYIMDEIDAALDSVACEKVAHLLREQAHTGPQPPQFVIISHRHQLYEACSRVVGIYQIDGGASRAVAVDVDGSN